MKRKLAAGPFAFPSSAASIGICNAKRFNPPTTQAALFECRSSCLFEPRPCDVRTDLTIRSNQRTTVLTERKADSVRPIELVVDIQAIANSLLSGY